MNVIEPYSKLTLSQQKNIFLSIPGWKINKKVTSEGYRLEGYPSLTLYVKDNKWKVYDHNPESNNYKFFKDDEKNGWDVADWLLKVWNNEPNRIKFYNVTTLGRAMGCCLKISKIKDGLYSKEKDENLQENFNLYLTGEIIDGILNNHAVSQKDWQGTDLCLFMGDGRKAKRQMMLKHAEESVKNGGKVLWMHQSKSKKATKLKEKSMGDKKIWKLGFKKQFNGFRKNVLKTFISRLEEHKFTHIYFTDIYSYFDINADDINEYQGMMDILNTFRKMGINIYGTGTCIKGWFDQGQIKYVRGHGRGVKQWGRIIFARNPYNMLWEKNREIKNSEIAKQKMIAYRKNEARAIELDAKIRAIELIEARSKEESKIKEKPRKEVKNQCFNKNTIDKETVLTQKTSIIPIVNLSINTNTNTILTNTKYKNTNIIYTNTYNNIIYNILTIGIKEEKIIMKTKQTQAELNTLLRMYKNKKRKIYAEYNGRVTEALRNPPVDITLCVELINEERDQVIYELGVKMFPNKEIKRPKRKERLEKYMQLAKNTQEPILWGWFRQACGFTTQGVPWGGLRVYAFSIIMAEIEKADRLKIMGKSEVDKVFELVRSISNEEESTPSAWELKQYCGEFLKTMDIPQYLDKINSDRKFKLQNIENSVKENGRALKLA